MCVCYSVFVPVCAVPGSSPLRLPAALLSASPRSCPALRAGLNLSTVCSVYIPGKQRSSEGHEPKALRNISDPLKSRRRSEQVCTPPFWRAVPHRDASFPPGPRGTAHAHNASAFSANLRLGRSLTSQSRVRIWGRGVIQREQCLSLIKLNL